MDAARVAIRQPGVESVTIFYRRTREEMPAYKEEIEAGLAEGIILEELVTPVAVHSRGRHADRPAFIRNELGAPDASGRRKPVPIQGSEFDVELDTLIVAISEEPEPAGLDGLGRTSWGTDHGQRRILHHRAGPACSPAATSSPVRTRSSRPSRRASRPRR